MRVYSRLEEENIRDENLVREWTASGLLDSTQSDIIRTELQTRLRQTNVFLRGVLWIFTTLIVIAGVGLLATTNSQRSPTQAATLFIFSGAVCWVMAEFACRNRLYRYGVEESLAVCAAVLFAIGML